MTDRELMQQALDALEVLAKYENPLTKIQVRKPRDGGPIVTMYPHKVATEAAAPLRERLAQPEQEPVSGVVLDEHGSAALVKNGSEDWHCKKHNARRLYTTPPQGIYYTPPQRKPLTDEELYKVFPAIATYTEANKTLYRSIARAIEAAHGITGENT